MARPKNSVQSLVGQTFGQLKVLAYYGDYKWYCRCSCGNYTTVRADNLKSGNTLACGCVNRQLHSERMSLGNRERTMGPHAPKKKQRDAKAQELHDLATQLVNTWFGKK